MFGNANKQIIPKSKLVDESSHILIILTSLTPTMRVEL